jgi:hypothetical protein
MPKYFLKFYLLILYSHVFIDLNFSIRLRFSISLVKSTTFNLNYYILSLKHLTLPFLNLSYYSVVNVIDPHYYLIPYF